MTLVRRKTPTFYLTEEMVENAENPSSPPAAETGAGKNTESLTEKKKFTYTLPAFALSSLKLPTALQGPLPSPRKALIVGLVLAISFSWALSSGDSKSATNETQLIQHLMNEQRRLEEEVKRLEARSAPAAQPVAQTSANESINNFPITERVFALDGSEKDDPFLGPKDSPLLVMVFSDFQCKLCRDFNLQTLPRIRSDYAEKSLAKVIYRDYPLANNEHAREAATFAHCAGEQGSYWKAFDVLKSHPQEIESGKFNVLQKLLPNLNQNDMSLCLRSVRYEKEIDLDQAQGRALGAKGAPSMFIGKLAADRSYHGVFVRGAQPYPVIQQEIERALKR